MLWLFSHQPGDIDNISHKTYIIMLYLSWACFFYATWSFPSLKVVYLMKIEKKTLNSLI